MVAGNGRAGVKACLHLTHLLQLGHTSRSFPNLSTNWRPRIQPCATLWGSYSSHHSILPPRLPVCVLGVCGYMHAPVYPVVSGCAQLESLCSGGPEQASLC